jgi:LacI family transcriptional regulator
MPIVSVGTENRIQHADTIRLNIKKPLFAAVKHLKELGHTHIAFIGEGFTQLKQSYFEAALKQYGLPCSADKLILTDTRFEDAGRQGAARLLQAKTPFTAVICAYDNIAIGAIKAFTEQGLRVPEDISVIGCNNIPAAGHLERSLTTIDEAQQAVCDIACDLLIKKMKNKYYCSGTDIEIAGSLILRETTAPANKKPPC